MRAILSLFTGLLVLSGVARGEPLTPLEAMRQAAARLPSVQAAQAVLESAQAYARSIGAQPNPYLRLSGTSGDPLEESNALVFPFEIGGQPRLREEVAQRDVSAREQDLLQERRVVALRTGQAYYTAWERQQTWEAARTRTALARQLEFSTLRRYEVGEIAQNSHIRAELELTRALSDEATAKADAEQASGILNLLLGRDPDSPVDFPATPTALPEPPPAPFPLPTNPATPELVPQVTVAEGHGGLQHLQQSAAQLPEVQALRYESQALQSQVELAKRAMSPSLQLQLYRSRIVDANAQGVQLSLVIPLWDWGQVDAEVQRREGLARAAQARVADRELQLRQRVLEIYKRLQGAEARKTILREQLAQSAKLAGDARRAYDANLMTLLEVFDAQQAYRQTLQTYISAHAEAARASLELAALDPHSFDFGGGPGGGEEDTHAP